MHNANTNPFLKESIMRTFRPLVAAVLMACAAPFSQVHAAPCAGFTDVDSSSLYCPNVEWIKNRLVTLGCAPNLYCPDAMVTRCLENRIFAITSNRVGEETNGGLSLRFIGQSEIVRPDGVIVKRLTESYTGIAVADIDLTQARRKTLNPFNDLFTGRRPDMYHLGGPKN